MVDRRLHVRRHLEVREIRDGAFVDLDQGQHALLALVHGLDGHLGNRAGGAYLRQPIGVARPGGLKGVEVGALPPATVELAGWEEATDSSSPEPQAVAATPLRASVTLMKSPADRDSPTT